MKIKLALNITRTLEIAEGADEDAAIDAETKKLEDAGWSVEVDSADEEDDDGEDGDEDEDDTE